jgi:hypothetical protein
MHSPDRHSAFNVQAAPSGFVAAASHSPVDALQASVLQSQPSRQSGRQAPAVFSHTYPSRQSVAPAQLDRQYRRPSARTTHEPAGHFSLLQLPEQ